MQPTSGGDTAVSKSERCSRLTHGARCSQVIAAAIRLFAQKGFQGTKTKEIADAAGINEALIFRDFRTKEKLYCAILDFASSRIPTEQWIEELAPYAAERDDFHVFSQLALKFLESFGREPELYRVMLYSALERHELAQKFRERKIEPLEHFIEQYVRTRQQEGKFRSADPHGFARCFLSMCHNRVLRQVLSGARAESPSDAEAARTFTEVFLAGVRFPGEQAICQ